MTDLDRTHWRRVAVALGAGVAISTLLGKIPPTVELLRTELALSLVTAAAVVSLFSLMLALLGLVMGVLVGRVGSYRAAMFGLLLSALASLLGAFSEGASMLLATRVLEGLGFIFASSALPTLIVASTTLRDRPVAMGLWGGFIPAGITLIMLLSLAALETFGWRGLWLISAALIVFSAAAMHWGFRGWRPAASSGAHEAYSGVIRRGPLLLAGVFLCYSAQFIGVVSFLPSVLQQDAGLSATTATAVVAVVVFCNVFGNAAAGWLIRHGWRPRQLVALTLLSMMASTVALYAGSGILTLQIAAAFVFTGLSGLIPGSLFATVPTFAERPTQIPLINGVMMQGVGIGQFIGPLLLAATVELLGGWHLAWVYTVCAAAMALLCVLYLPESAPEPTPAAANAGPAD